MFFDWHPTVVHDLHESVGLLITWNGTAPTSAFVDPVTYDERFELSFHEMQTLTAFGMPGVWTYNFGDDFAHLYLDSIGLNHNSDRPRLRDLRQRHGGDARAGGAGR